MEISKKFNSEYIFKVINLAGFHYNETRPI